ncbi:MAG: methanol--corrinoid methyltransferase [bacterium]|nr:methanol--corrinoid methyltransferase [bacterium]
MATNSYTKLAIENAAELVFGQAPRPLTCGHDLTIGSGRVYPEINFTLPPMEVTGATMPAVREQYQKMIDGVCQRAVDLQAPGLVVEFELLPPMTIQPEWGESIVALLRSTLDQYHDKYGLTSALRATPTDVRDGERPIRRRSGRYWEAMRESFRRCAAAGADLMSIESTGGKEISDEAIVQCDLQAVLVALGILGPRAMACLWDQIGEPCRGTGCVPAGDTACAFANTAMVLADRKMIPKVVATVVRTVSAVRSLVAYECGAVGPSKDCAYEGPFIKAIAGVPISLEGKSAACAHLSSLGNIAAATADLWSNESVQNVRLLGGDAPVVSVEQLIYDCRLMNVAAADGADGAGRLRDWMVRSDAPLDPQAYILTPENVIRIAGVIVGSDDAFTRSRRTAAATLDILREGAAEGALQLDDREKHWLDMLQMQLDIIPADESAAIRAASLAATKDLVPSEYGIDRAEV